MKYRKSFVTNSSSSCYISAVTGEEYSGWDISLSEFDLYRCKNGHTFEERFLIELPERTLEEKRKWLLKQYEGYTYAGVEDTINELKRNDTIVEDYYEDYMADMRYGMPAEACPVCQMEYFTDEDLLALALNRLGMSRNQLKEHAVSLWASLSEMLEDINEDKK